MLNMNISEKMRMLALCTMLLVTAAGGYAQTDASAKALLDKVSNTYREYKVLQADFTLAATQPQQAEANYSESGTILMETAAGKYRITMNNQELISDGQSLWTVLKDAQEVQVTEVDNSSSSISPVTIFSFYTEGY